MPTRRSLVTRAHSSFPPSRQGPTTGADDSRRWPMTDGAIRRNFKGRTGQNNLLRLIREETDRMKDRRPVRQTDRPSAWVAWSTSQRPNRLARRALVSPWATQPKLANPQFRMAGILSKVHLCAVVRSSLDYAV